MKANKIIIFTLLTMVGGGWTEARSQEVLTLDTCRVRALKANAGLKRAEVKMRETEALEKVALWQMLPKVSANGTYNWMEKSTNLLSDEQKDRLNHLSGVVQEDLSASIRQEFGGLPIIGDAIANGLINILSGSTLSTNIDNVGHRITEALETDTRNVVAGTVTVTQPVFMGGKLLALHKMASLANELSGVEYDREKEAMLIAVDEAYWQVVSVKHKKELAEQYAALLNTLNNDVEEMMRAEVATKGDLTKVRVKLNEAQMSLTKATNGLALAKMLLAQRCGMPLDSEYDVADHNILNDQDVQNNQSIDMNTVWAKRKEMRMLRISDSVALQGVRIARSTFMPNVAVTGGYLVSNPNLFNGFSKEFGGTFFAGVVVNIPILHGGSFYSLKAAKAKREEVKWQMEEAKEMIELQVSKVRFELELAYKKLAQAQSNLDNAEENLKLADESFKAGMASSSDLMAAQTAWIQAKGDVLDAEIEIEMGKVYLKQALGN
ncbi:MAG: TolC family protein [Bacteroidales bacterium]|nr:TolC family protein [Bacteroidales bacterium]